jgi:hypothetical protein
MLCAGVGEASSSAKLMMIVNGAELYDSSVSERLFRRHPHANGFKDNFMPEGHDAIFYADSAPY